MPVQISRAPAQITCLLVKVASRCNLACAYCYVYEHADQSWRAQPHVMSAAVRDSLAARLAEYVVTTKPERLSIIFHGGEPLLAGASAIAEFARCLRLAAGKTRLDIGLQTNGVLLSGSALAILAAANVGISLSLDGPAHVHDRHRIGKRGEPSFDDVYAALGRLRQYPEVFTGVIAVVDPASDASALIRWFADQHLPALDLLLPDANYDNPPIGRADLENAYTDWMTTAFDTWYDECPEMPVRSFDAVVGAICGLPSGTDAFGFGDVSLLSIETDGAYHDLDVLKTTFEGRTALGMHLRTHSIVDAAQAPRMEEHRQLLTLEGLSHSCQVCPEVTICAGGAVPHRFRTGSAGGGFANPSIYCAELLTLIEHVRARVTQTLSEESDARHGAGQSGVLDWGRVDDATTGLHALAEPLSLWRSEALRDLNAALSGAPASGPSQSDVARFRELALAQQEAAATTASAQLWLKAYEAGRRGFPLRAMDGTTVAAEGADLKQVVARAISNEQEIRPAVHRDDRLLRLPFGAPIEFLVFDSTDLGRHLDGVRRSLEAVDEYNPSLRHEMAVLCSDVQFIRDTSAHHEKSVSFSDDSVPGSLFVGVPHEWTEFAIFDVADSLIHEHRHQKLYLIARGARLLEADQPLVHSPWREEPRPPSGVLHALFVFVELLGFWQSVARRRGVSAEMRTVAQSHTEDIVVRLTQGFEVIQTCSITPAGAGIVSQLRKRAGIP